MQTPQQVLDAYFLDHRHMLLEVAAYLDRYDAAVERDGEPAADLAKLHTTRRAIAALLEETGSVGGRVERLLELYAEDANAAG